MLRSNVLRLVCCLLIAALAFAQTKKRVTLKTGGVLKGVVKEVDGQYEIVTRVGLVKVAKDQVASIEDLITPEDEYSKRLEQIDPTKAEDHFKLGEWALGQGLLKNARKELKAALELNKDHEMAALLLREVEAKIKLADARRRPPGLLPTTLPTLPGGMKFNPKWLVTEEEIYRIRLGELRGTDRVRVSFRGKLIDRFIDIMQGRRDFERPRFANEFRAYRPVEKAIYILDNVPSEQMGITDDILIKSDPAFMVDFRSRIWPIVANYCATTDCHGGKKLAGRLRLFKVAGKNVQVDYTNFMILESYAFHGRKLIDRDHKDLSLLLHYGLPPEQAKYNHSTRLRRFPYRSRNSLNYRRMLAWIRSLGGPPSPDYGVKLRIPWAPKGGRVSLPDAPPPTQPTTGLSPVD